MNQNKQKKSNNLQHQAQILQASNATFAQLKRHEGPLPDPETLQRYEAIVPGFAERIMAMAESEQKHRHSTDISIIENQHKQHKRDTDTFRLGQVFALVAVAGVLALCYFMATKGCATAAASIGVAAIVGVIVAFHNRKPERAKTMEEKKSPEN